MILTLAAGSLVLGLGFGFAQMGQGKGPGAGAGYAQVQTQPLSEEAKNALLEALTGPEGEYAAYAMYTAVIEKYGEVEPYVSIRKAEAKHIEALKRQLDRYGVDYPAENPYLGQVSAPESLEDAAKAWAEGEVANVAMYDRLMEAVKDYPNLVQVFDHLRAASQERHLPAFSLAAENGGTLSPEQMQELHDTFASQRGQGQGNHGGQDCQQQGQGQGHGPHGGAGPRAGSGH
ncbi:ferritin-like domain-containing protein [Oceanithermus profundus]